MKSNLFASPSGMLLVAAGIAVAELVASFATSATSPAQASSVEIFSQANSVELAEQPSDNPMAKDDDDKPDKPDRLKKPKDDDDDDDDDAAQSATCSCSEGVFKDVSKKTGIEKSKLRLVKVERETWSDGCLGLGSSGSTCTQAKVPGWRVVVGSGQQRWVYRANESGSVVKLDEVATRTLISSATTVTRREEVTTRTTETSQAVTGSNQSSQSVVGSSQTMTGASTRTQQQTILTRNLARVNFSDISQSYWARDFIMAMGQRGILTGFPDGKFHPDKPVTRAEFAALVASVFKKNKVRNAISFRDVASSYWAYNGIREAYEMGFLSPISGSQFRPYENLTRLQVLSALAKGLNLQASGSTEEILKVYSDAAAIPAEYRNLVAAATERGIVVNYPNVSTCSPNKVATRAEVAALLYQAMVSNGEAVAISSPYIAGNEVRVREAGQVRQTGERKKPPCNQGIGNGAEGCDPGNSRPHGGSNDEGGRTPGNRPR